MQFFQPAFKILAIGFLQKREDLLLPDLADAFDRIQFRRQDGAGMGLPVKSDGEAMHFVLKVFQEEKRIGLFVGMDFPAPEHQIRRPMTVILAETENGDLKFQGGESPFGAVHLWPAAVDDDEVGQARALVA